MCMSRDPLDTCDHSTMLNSTVRIQEFATYCANSGTQRMDRQFLQPRRVIHLGIVVEKYEQFAIGIARGKIIQARPIELPSITYNSYPTLKHQCLKH